MGYQFFPCSRFTENEHGSLRGGYQVNLADDVPQGRALADQVTEGLGLHHRFLQVSILKFQLSFEALNFLKGARIGDGGPKVISEHMAPRQEFLLKRLAGAR